MATTGQGAAAFVFDGGGRLLVLRHTYEDGVWGPPGGRIEPGEDPLDCVVREALEETGLGLAVEHLIGLYRMENGFTAYALACRIVAGEPTIQDTSRSPRSPGSRPMRSRSRRRTCSATRWQTPSAAAEA